MQAVGVSTEKTACCPGRERPSTSTPTNRFIWAPDSRKKAEIVVHRRFPQSGEDVGAIRFHVRPESVREFPRLRLFGLPAAGQERRDFPQSALGLRRILEIEPEVLVCLDFHVKPA